MAAAAKRWLQAIEILPQVDAAFGKWHLLVRYEDLLDPDAGGREALVAFLSCQFPTQTFALDEFAWPKIGAAIRLGLFNPSEPGRPYPPR